MALEGRLRGRAWCGREPRSPQSPWRERGPAHTWSLLQITDPDVWPPAPGKDNICVVLSLRERTRYAPGHCGLRDPSACFVTLGALVHLRLGLLFHR